MKVTGQNPILYTDYPDVDVIRVDDTYYMVSTTMHFMPGCVILRSYDLIHWEIASYVYDRLDDTPGQCLTDGKGIYGKGMWAASLRYHKGTFYVCFVANDTHKTYLYQAENINGPWTKQNIEGFYHDNSLLFDEDGRVYIAYGNREIYITELNETLTAPKEGGLHRMVVRDTDAAMLGYEGTHFYKINGKYYLIFIHWPKGGLRTEAVFCADSLLGEFTGGDVLQSDLDERQSGCAQGGIVDTPEGDWYSIVFQDHGAVGRIPVLVPVKWQNDFPVFGDNGVTPKQVTVASTRPDYKYEPLWCSDEFTYTPNADGTVTLQKPWQWNHTPDWSLISFTEKANTMTLQTGITSVNVVNAQNMLTQRTVGEHCFAEITVDAEKLCEGDYAGLCALEGDYAFIALTKTSEGYQVCLMEQTKDEQNGRMGGFDAKPGALLAQTPIACAKLTFRMECDLSLGQDKAKFFYRVEGQEGFTQLGEEKQLSFRLDHFCGCRFGLFVMSTKQAGGKAEFTHYVMGTDWR